MTAARFFENIKGKRVAFCGIGVSNAPLVLQFLQKGAIVTACDKRTREELGAIADELEAAGAALRLGPDYFKNLEADIIFRTPGMLFHMPELERARENGVVVTSETEVFFDLCPCEIFAVTGSDGKTTTTTVIAEMLRRGGRTVRLGGNIGKALLPEIESVKEDDLAAVELSSFQLISMRKSPDVAVITNIAPNHLDMHKDMQEYIDAKKNIILHQGAFSRAVLNADNEITAAMKPLVRGEALMFSRRGEVRDGAYEVPGGEIFMNYKGVSHKVMDRADIKLPGDHNAEDYLAAICAVWGYVSPENMRLVAREFGGVEHRMEFVRELRGVKWYNDSIASSPTRVIAGLIAHGKRIILIAGGYDKKIPFEPLAPYINKYVKYLILMGDTADKIECVVTANGSYDPAVLTMARAKNMEEAVRLAAAAAGQDDIVALSPACASFDMYPMFEDRGRHFKELVNKLIDNGQWTMDN